MNALRHREGRWMMWITMNWIGMVYLQIPYLLTAHTGSAVNDESTHIDPIKVCFEKLSQR